MPNNYDSAEECDLPTPSWLRKGPRKDDSFLGAKSEEYEKTD